MVNKGFTLSLAHCFSYHLQQKLPCSHLLDGQTGIGTWLTIQIDYVAASWAMLWVFSCSIKGSFVVFKCFDLLSVSSTKEGQFLPHFSRLEEETIKEK